jgi:hypothetical protein
MFYYINKQIITFGSIIASISFEKLGQIDIVTVLKQSCLLEIIVVSRWKPFVESMKSLGCASVAEWCIRRIAAEQ